MKRKYKIGEQFILSVPLERGGRGVKNREYNHGKLVEIVEFQNDIDFPYIVKGVNEPLKTEIHDNRYGAMEENLIPNTKLHKALL